MDGYALPVPRRSVVRLDDLVANDVQHAITPVKMKRVTITFRQQVDYFCHHFHTPDWGLCVPKLRV